MDNGYEQYDDRIWRMEDKQYESVVDDRESEREREENGDGID